jgi:hypothetical protein
MPAGAKPYGGKKKPRQKPGKKKAWLLLLLPLVSGCATVDWLTGANEPAVLNWVEKSIVEQAAQVAQHALPAPWGLLVGALLGAAAVLYRNHRKTKAT